MATASQLASEGLVERRPCGAITSREELGSAKTRVFDLFYVSRTLFVKKANAMTGDLKMVTVMACDGLERGSLANRELFGWKEQRLDELAHP